MEVKPDLKQLFLLGGGPDPEKLEDAKWETSPNLVGADCRRLLQPVRPLNMLVSDYRKMLKGLLS